MAASKKQPKSMDIQKSGESPPDSSSRPIITSRPMLLQDPMIKEPSNSDDSEAAPRENKNMTLSSKTIKPPDEMDQETVSSITKSDLKKNTETNDTIDQPAQATDSIDPDNTPVSSEAAVVDAVVKSANGSNLSNEQKNDLADEKRKQAVKELIEGKKYIVPIGQVTRARHNRQILLLFIFLLIVVAGYAVIDLGLVSLPFKLPFEFFK